VEIYLPIAEQSMNVFVLLGLGAAAGLLAGMFGVGGGFLATPLLIFVGIPPAVAVASQANQVIANSISSLQVQWRRGNVDLRMGLILLLGGMVGSTAGVSLFTYLKRIGQIDFVIAVLYVVMLSTIGVRPNSPPHKTSVSSSKPRCFRSLIKAALAWSVWPACSFTPL